MKKCQICSGCFSDYEIYEYRGKFACEEHFEALIKIIDNARDNGIFDDCEQNRMGQKNT